MLDRHGRHRKFHTENPVRLLWRKKWVVLCVIEDPEKKKRFTIWSVFLYLEDFNLYSHSFSARFPFDFDEVHRQSIYFKFTLVNKQLERKMRIFGPKVIHKTHSLIQALIAFI